MREESKLVLLTFILTSSSMCCLKLNGLLVLLAGTLIIVAYSLAKGLPEDESYWLCLQHALLLLAFIAALSLYVIVRVPEARAPLGLDYMLLLIVSVLIVRLVVRLAYALARGVKECAR